MFFNFLLHLKKQYYIIVTNFKVKGKLVMEKEQIIEFLDKPETVPHLQSLESGEEIKKYLNENDIEISLEKANELKKIFDLFKEKNGEISDEELKNISGGTNLTKEDYINIGKTVVGVAILGLVIGGAGKFGYDVKKEYDRRQGANIRTSSERINKIISKTKFDKFLGEASGTVRDFASDVSDDLDDSKRSLYRKAVVYTANLFNEEY